MELRKDSDKVVDELATGDPISESGEDQIIEFTASSDITTYRCEPHPNMEGTIELT
ncbi:plastocyanin/azurin family copper-binding protein [Natrinema gelatinilyticum]|uniref:plastocyanin/azurin family copper-binding protein n=1 Tax=Natrinema gelatinilyticum TaxID=2961571 RepID=UPI0020C43525|nr:plastocyanin/azurin family copper-binding protein [Natrinema gelatinilyticum]